VVRRSIDLPNRLQCEAALGAIRVQSFISYDLVSETPRTLRRPIHETLSPFRLGQRLAAMPSLRLFPRTFPATCSGHPAWTAR